MEQPTKPGYKTTEFWLGLITVVLTYLNDALGWNVPVTVVVAAVGLVATYTIGRSMVKKEQVKQMVP